MNVKSTRIQDAARRRGACHRDKKKWSERQKENQTQVLSESKGDESDETLESSSKERLESFKVALKR